MIYFFMAVILIIYLRYFISKSKIQHGVEYESAYRALEKTSKDCWSMSLEEYVNKHNTTIDRLVAESIYNNIPIGTKNLNTTLDNSFSLGLEGSEEWSISKKFDPK